MNCDTLTLEAARSLEAGPETDALIAAMCGKRGSVVPVVEFDTGEEWEEFQSAGRCWSPSTDANHAIEAAEVGGGSWRVERLDGGLYFAVFALNGYAGTESAETPALALCRARASFHVRERNRKANAKVIAGDVP